MSRSWTNPLTNSVVLDGVDVSRFIKWFTSGSFENLQDSRVLNEFIHEYTHHWCFYSLVSSATNILNLRINLFAESLPKGRPLWARDYLAVHAIMRLLRPLAEGMAQFAEFDTWNSARCHRFASPISAMELCFGSVGRESTEFLLSLMRQNEEILTRKSSLYLKDVEIEEGYLAGYSLVKRLHRVLCFKQPSLTQELFLSYLRQFIWNDAGLVIMLLTEDVQHPRIGLKVSDRIISRINRLFTDDSIPNRILEYERRSLNGETFVDTEIGISAQEISKAQEWLNIYFGETQTLLQKEMSTVSQTLQTGPRSIEHFIAGFPLIRGHIVIAQEKMTLRHEGERLFVKDASGYEAELKKKMPHDNTEFIEGDYLFTAIMSTFTSYLVLLLQGPNGQNMVFGQLSNTDTKIDMPSLFRLASEYRSFFNFGNLLGARFASRGFSAISSTALTEATSAIDKMAYEYYLEAMLIQGIDSADRPNLSLMLQETGLRSIFADEFEHLRLFAIHSLLNNMSTNIFDLAIRSAVFGIKIPPHEQKAWLDKLLERFGSKLLLSKNGEDYLIHL